MADAQKVIKVRSLVFLEPPFRKLKNIEVKFADRITLIAGHNGIGKSTILGLVSNTFGIPRKGPRSYFGEPFSANIERIVYLALSEVEIAQKHPASAPQVRAQVNGAEVVKRCAMTKRGEWKRARVVPRTIDSAAGEVVGQDAKIPLPTIYLGIRRLASAGEADERSVDSTESTMEGPDRKVMVDFVSQVILGAKVTENVTTTSIKGSEKKVEQPGYALHDAHAISLGQDSLGSIATALASFHRLKREQQDDYVGGLLVIDELDAGLHPHAIDRLVKALRKFAKQLRLQIIATTHSPRLIEVIHPEGEGSAEAPDSVVYLLDTKHPRLAPDQSLPAILQDMDLRQDIPAAPSKRPQLCIYFEDDQAKQFFEAIVPVGQRRVLSRKHGISIKLIGLGVGGSNLIKLPEKDPIFLQRLLVVDADTTIPKASKARGNTVKLPTPRGTIGRGRSPENMIKSFLRSAADADDGALFDVLQSFNVANPSSDKVQAAFFSDGSGESEDRESSKKWWIKHWKMLKQWNVLPEWVLMHEQEVAIFLSQFETALEKTVTRLKSDKAGQG